LYAEAEGDVIFIAGGMSLMQAIKSRLLTPDCVIDLNRLDELKGISHRDNTISIGAMTRYRDVASNRNNLAGYEALCDAAEHVGDRQVRNRGTVGGSLSWNYVSACTPVAALAVDAEVEILRGKNGKIEKLGIDDFQKGPMETALEEGDLLLRVNLPLSKTPSGSAYKKWGVVKDALPVIGVGVYIELSKPDKCSKARFAVGGLSSGPARSHKAEDALLNGNPADNDYIERAVLAAADEIETDSDPWISAEYKTNLIKTLGVEVLERTLSLAKERAG
jgi:carbon-monoxide dehydrogenase medium subunit